MTNLRLLMTTAGLNVPADSQPLPCGERMGAFDARCQAPKIQLVAALKTSGDESASKTSPALPPTRRAKRIKQDITCWGKPTENSARTRRPNANSNGLRSFR